DGIAADADAGGLADAEHSELMDGLVSERPAATDYSNVSLFVNAAGHDADFAFAGRNDARAVRADEARLLEIHDGGHAYHVEHGNAFGDANDKRKASVGSFENGVGGVRRGNEDDRGVGVSGLGGLCDSV